MLSLSVLYTRLRANVFTFISPCRETVKKTPCPVLYVVSAGCNACVNFCEKADRCEHVFIVVRVYNKNAFHRSVSLRLTHYLLA